MFLGEKEMETEIETEQTEQQNNRATQTTNCTQGPGDRSTWLDSDKEEKWELIEKQPGERQSLRPFYVPYNASPAAPWGVQRCFKALGMLKEVELVTVGIPVTLFYICL